MWQTISHLTESTQTMCLHPKIHSSPTHHLTKKPLNYLPSTSDLNRNRSAAQEKLHSVNIKAYSIAMADENGLTFHTPAAKTLYTSNVDLTTSGKLQQVKKENPLPTSQAVITAKNHSVALQKHNPKKKKTEYDRLA